MTIGEKLKMIRGRMTQAEAASKIGMKQQSWRVYETDGSAPGAGLIKRICEAFGVSADWLLETNKADKGVIAQNSAVVIGSGVAINGNAHTRAHAYGEGIECRECPYLKKIERIAKIIEER